MFRAIALLLTFVTTISLQAQIAGSITRTLRVSPDKHKLVFEDGMPFFWLGDTGWELFHRLSKKDAERYLQTRKEQGFTVIQAVVLAELDGLNTPNAEGETPLENNDPTRPREAYFKHVDWVVDRAAELGIYIGLLPTWADKIFKDRWGVGPEIFNIENARTYGRYLGNRYKDRKNIIWVLGGDRNPRNDGDVEIWRSMAAGVVDGVGGQDRALMTFHPQPSKTSSSSPWFHQDQWLDFNMLQTGHCNDTRVWNLIGDDYKLTPTKPTINGEPIYEDHPVCFNTKDKGYSTAYDVRKAAWLSVFSGALGVTYGCHGVWQMWSPDKQEVNRPLRYWYTSLQLPGANQMRHLRRLIESSPDMKPDQSIVLQANDSTTRIQAMTGTNTVLVYSAGGEPIRINVTRLKLPPGMPAFWYDPRTGAYFPAGVVNNKVQQTFTCPSKGFDNDWVLVISNAPRRLRS